MTNDNDNIVNFPGGEPPVQPKRDEEGMVPQEKREQLLKVLRFYLDHAKAGRITCLAVCAQGMLDNDRKDPNATRFSVVTSAGEPSHPLIGCIEDAKYGIVFSDEVVDDPDDDE